MFIGPAGIIFAVTIIVSAIGMSKPELVEKLLLRPYQLTRKSEYYRLITSGLVHADLGHLAFNMLTFYFFAFSLERVLGPVYFVALYLIGLVLSNVGTWYKHRNDPAYASLGASGAILAVLFAYIAYFPDSMLYLMFALPIPAWLFAVGYLAYSWWSSRQNRDRINHDAHIFGAITGLAFVAVVDPGAYRRLFEVVGV
jgi:membrane associated rhomboid family serine protease